jgi:hypothetical protein
MQVVNQAATQPILTAQAVRNRRGQMTSVILTTEVQLSDRGSGVPTGTVTYFINGRSRATKSLQDGTAVVTVSANRALNDKSFVTYSGDGNFLAGRSPKLLINRKLLSVTARPLTAFFAQGRHGHGALLTPTVKVLSRMAGLVSRVHGVGR